METEVSSSPAFPHLNKF